MPHKNMLQRFVSVLVCSALLSNAADLDLQIVVTREIHGAVDPLDETGASCDGDDVEQCNSCLGGAARRHKALQDAKAEGAATNTDVVTIDTGAFFFGASPFFHAFSGSVRYVRATLRLQLSCPCQKVTTLSGSPPHFYTN